MSNIWLFYNQYYQRVPVKKGENHSFTVGRDVQQTVTLREFPFQDGPLEIETDGFTALTVKQNGKSIGKATIEEPFQLKQQTGSLSIFLTGEDKKTETYFIGSHQELTFSPLKKSSVVFKTQTSIIGKAEDDSFQLVKMRTGWMVEHGNSILYLNGQRISNNTKVETGDFLFLPFMTIRLLEDDLLEIKSLEDYETSLSLARRPQSEMSKKYPVYRRTPRMIYELPNEKVTLSFPAQESDDTNRGLWLIIMPPLIMLIVMGVVALIQPRGIFIIISMVMFMTTMVTSSVQYFKDKSTQKKRKERRYRVYTQYLENKRSELQDLAEKQKQVLKFHFPSFERMKYLTGQISDRLWERSLESHDFLQFRLGTGTIPPSYQVNVSAGDLANREIDDLLEQSQLMEKVYREIKNVPVVADLSQGAIGLVGKEAVVMNEIHQIIGQLSFFHSYHDLRFVFIFTSVA